MSDLSGISTEDLMRAAGMGAPADLSAVPTEHLLQVAGLDGPKPPAFTAENRAKVATAAMPDQLAQPTTDIPSALPTIARTADDAVRSVASGATFGLADEGAAAARSMLGGPDYGTALTQERQRDAAISPYVRIPGEIAGGLATGLGAQRAGLTFLNAASPTIGNMAARGAAEGATYGALHGFGSGEGTGDRLTRAATGGAVGAVTGGATGAVAGKMAQNAARATIPSADELSAAGTKAYQAAEDAGVVVKPESFAAAVDDITASLKGEGYHPGIHPKVKAALGDLQEAAASGQPQTLQDLDILRRVAKSAAGSNERDERRIASTIIGKIDDFVSGLKPTDVQTGDAMKGVSALNEARDYWARFRKGDLIDDLMTRAADRASQFSGSGMENAIRTEFRQLLRSKGGLKGFSDEEVAAIRNVVRGGPLDNLARYFGKLAPTSVVSAAGGGGLGGSIGGAVGGFLGGPVGAAVGAPVGAASAMGIGGLARTAAEGLTRGNVADASALIRAGGDLPPLIVSPGLQRLLGVGTVALPQEGAGLLSPRRRVGLLDR